MNKIVCSLLLMVATIFATQEIPKNHPLFPVVSSAESHKSAIVKRQIGPTNSITWVSNQGAGPILMWRQDPAGGGQLLMWIPPQGGAPGGWAQLVPSQGGAPARWVPVGGGEQPPAWGNIDGPPFNSISWASNGGAGPVLMWRQTPAGGQISQWVPPQGGAPGRWVPLGTGGPPTIWG